MRRIAVINQKGGVGKTTTTANLGAALSRLGQRVLLVDLDPQGHLSLHFGTEVTDEQASVYDILTGSLDTAEVLREVGANITLIPADIDLAGAEAELISVTGREVVLREALDGLDDRYDFLLIDCAPSLGVLTINALVAAHEVVIPLQAHFLALQGLGKLLDTVTLVRQRINPELSVSGIVLCMHDTTTRLAGEVLDDLNEFLTSARGSGVPWAEACVFPTFIRRNIKLAESASFGQTVFDYAPTSNGAVDYAALAMEIVAYDPHRRPVESTQPAATRGLQARVVAVADAPDSPTGRAADSSEKTSDTDTTVAAGADGSFYSTGDRPGADERASGQPIANDAAGPAGGPRDQGGPSSVPSLASADATPSAKASRNGTPSKRSRKCSTGGVCSSSAQSDPGPAPKDAMGAMSVSSAHGE